MPETYIDKLTRERKERLARIAKAALKKPAPAIAPTIKIPAKPEEPKEPEDLSPRDKAPFTEIMKEVCKYYRISMLDILSARRSSNIVLARHVIAYIASQHTAMSLTQIGSRLNRDHTTIMHALKRMKRLLETEVISQEVSSLKERLRL